MARRRRSSGNNRSLIMLGLGAAALWFMSTPGAPTAALPSAGSPTEYWIDPSTNRLWYEFGGVLHAPSPGMRPASSWEISTLWPPANHPEFAAMSIPTPGYGYL